MNLPDMVWRSFLLALIVLSALAAGQVLNKFLTPGPAGAGGFCGMPP